MVHAWIEIENKRDSTIVDTIMRLDQVTIRQLCYHLPLNVQESCSVWSTVAIYDKRKNIAQMVEYSGKQAFHLLQSRNHVVGISRSYVT